jgi:hypothetical protein
VEITQVLVNEASISEMPELISQGCVEVLCHGLQDEDLEKAAMTCSRLTVCLRNSWSDEGGNVVMARFGAEGGLEFINELRATLEDEEMPEGLDGRIREFMDTWDKIEDDNEEQTVW